ncbi:MAG: hypothetical protein PHO80_02405, partial [Candidatus Gracilibacteria bacterium]|nr:hypothetical protein [Candidatus Gracilibacteria bacterium]
MTKTIFKIFGIMLLYGFFVGGEYTYAGIVPGTLQNVSITISDADCSDKTPLACDCLDYRHDNFVTIPVNVGASQFSQDQKNCAAKRDYNANISLSVIEHANISGRGLGGIAPRDCYTHDQCDPGCSLAHPRQAGHTPMAGHGGLCTLASCIALGESYRDGSGRQISDYSSFGVNADNIREEGQYGFATRDPDCTNPGAGPAEQYKSMVSEYDNNSNRTIDRYRNTYCYNYGEAFRGAGSSADEFDNIKVKCTTYCRSGGTSKCYGNGACFGTGSYGEIDDDAPKILEDNWNDVNGNKLFAFNSDDNDKIRCNLDEYIGGKYTGGYLNGCTDQGNGLDYGGSFNGSTDLLENILFKIEDKSGIKRIIIRLGGCTADIKSDAGDEPKKTVNVAVKELSFSKVNFLSLFKGTVPSGFTFNGSPTIVDSSSTRLDKACLADGKNPFIVEAWDGTVDNDYETMTGYPKTDFFNNDTNGINGNNTAKYYTNN